MKLRNIIVLIIVLTTSFTSLFGQNSETGFSCGQNEMQQKYWQENPQAKFDFERILQNASKFNSTSDAKRGTKKYIIPIVFHILHENGEENISDDQVKDQIKILNSDFNKLNADTSKVQDEFKELIANCNFEFRLATLDPKGNCTNGINHYYSNLTNNANDISKINQWDRAKYLNVWVVKTIGRSGVAGYAYFPIGALGEAFKADGVIILHNYIGSIGTSNANRSRALTHEIGHYLGLPHVWGGGDPEKVCGDDGINDTPITKGHESCTYSSNSSKNACTENSTTIYTFNGVTTTSGQIDTTKFNTNTKLISYPISAKNLSTNSSLNKLFSFTKWPEGGKNNDTLSSSQNGSIDLKKYYEIKMQASKGNLIDINSISFQIGRNNKGVKNFVVRTNADNFTSNIPLTIFTKLNPTNSINFSYDTIKCQNSNNASPKLASDFTLGGYFTGSTTVFIDSLTGKIDLVKTKPGSYDITYTLPATALTSKITNTNKVVIIPIESSKISYASSDVCQTGSIKPNVQGVYGGTFIASNNVFINASTGVIDLSKSLPGSYKITYQVSDLNNCMTENHTSINIITNTVKSTKFSYPAFCKNQDSLFPLTDSLFAKGGYFSSLDRNLKIDSLTGNVNLKTSLIGQYKIFYNLKATNCNKKITDSTSIKIINDTTSTIKYVSLNYCDTTLTSILPTITGNKNGVFSSDDSLTIDPKTGAINFKLSKFGVHIVNYKTSGINSCNLEAKAKINYTINTFIDSINSIKYSSYFYTNPDTVDIKPIITGVKTGTFTADDSLFVDKTSGKISFNKSKNGVHTINYNTIDANKCKVQAITSINYVDTTNYSPVVNFSFPVVTCASIPSLSPVLAPNFVNGGVFTANNNLKINSKTGEIDLVNSKLDSTSYKIKYTISTKLKVYRDSVTIKINNPKVKLSYPSIISNQGGQLNPSLLGDLSGKFYATPGLKIDSITGKINLGNSKAGNHIVSYKAKNVCHDTTVTFPISIVVPSVRLTTSNELIFVNDTNTTIYVSSDLTGKLKDLKNKDTLKFRIFGWNAEDASGSLDLDSLLVSTKLGAVENVENYMEYSYCSNMFTLGQANVMRFSLESSLSSRNNLWKDSNLVATGVKNVNSPITCTPKADFYSNLKNSQNLSTMVCSGTPLIFNDITSNSPVTSRTWIFENGTPATSTEASPEVVFNRTGGHDVTLIVSNGTSTDTMYRKNYIYVTEYSSENGYLTENFNTGYSWDWRIEDNNTNSSRFGLSNGNGKGKTQSLKLDNYRDVTKYQSYQEEYYYYDKLAGTKHSIITPAINLSTTKNVTISFDYAFATDAYYDSLMLDVLNIYSSSDCGQKWTKIKSIGGPQMAVSSISSNTLVTAGNSSGSAFLPTSDNVWKNATISLPVNSLVDTKTRIKFEFVASKFSNNLYIDNVNINGTLQIEESPITQMNLNIYPNPVAGNENITISYQANNEDVKFELIDVQGKTITSEVNTSKNSPVNHTMTTPKLNAGCYFVKATQGAFTSTFKVVVL